MSKKGYAILTHNDYEMINNPAWWPERWDADTPLLSLKQYGASTTALLKYISGVYYISRNGAAWEAVNPDELPEEGWVVH